MTPIIDEKTQIPLFAVLAIIPVLSVVIFWLTSIEAKATANESRIQRIERVYETLLDMRDRLARIEEQLKQRGK